MQYTESWLAPYFTQHFGFKRPDWTAMSDPVEQGLSEAEKHTAWHQIAKIWLGWLAEGCKTAYEQSESNEFLIFAPANYADRQALHAYLETSYQQILQQLPGIASPEGYGKHLVILLHDDDHFQRYLSYFYQQSSLPMTCADGVFVNDGYGQLVLRAKPLPELASTIAHELTHACLTHLALPVWLDEGVADFIEDQLCQSAPFYLNEDAISQHGRYWTDQLAQQFWQGRSFFADDDEQCGLSYHLARALVQTLLSDYDSFKQFVQQANWSDAGAAAFAKVYQLPIESLLAPVFDCPAPAPAQWLK